MLKKFLSVKALALCLVALMLVFSMVNNASAGPISIKVTGTNAGGVGDGKQKIVFQYTIKNTSQHEYIGKINWVEVEVTGSWGNGRQEKYKRKVNINYAFNPALGPGKSKTLKTNFYRTVNRSNGMFKYDRVNIKILKYGFKRAS